MRKLLKSLVLLLLVVAVALPLTAQEKKKRKKKGEKRDPVATAVNKRLEKVEMTEEQHAKVKEVIAKHSPKIAAIREKSALTPDQRKAIAAARKEAVDAGKKGRELRAAIDAAGNLSEEQKKAQAELREANAALNKDLAALLTPEQREKAGLGGGKNKNKKKKKKADN